ncbi:HK97 gp10 family phage protein [Lacticaseibacillus saniviri]|uniref:HK97 gp10 family phage protein n=1 Tax=Lacticaseibacillus saniviri JCM 17471 = DSM 24301 TaxID=1293598 RepID=A0A0R2MST5_9LACO|nr:HK97 gp10 family phage protein [Lacticaseibacillus saniviri]KRO16632.1 hypothetical protein IV56_GL001077 [Lacticaseibacillus saniviri JCM 17471 = DSM 24301]
MAGWGHIEDAEFQAFAKRVHGTVDSGEVKRGIESALQKAAEYILREVKQRTPVDTGGLRRAWSIEGSHYSSGAFSVVVINPKEYASFVEEGHRQTPGLYVPAIGKRLKASWVEGKHMLKSTEADLQSNLDKIISPEIDKVLQKAFG